MCECECGNSSIVQQCHLRSGETKSCGCFSKENPSKLFKTHGLSKTPTYRTWAGMLSRCRDKKLKNYGAAGIKVCRSWRKFENFYADMGERPEGKSLDRLNNSLGYFKENCRWATRIEQNRNTSRNVWLTDGRNTMIMSDWALTLGVTFQHINYQIYRGDISKLGLMIAKKQSASGIKSPDKIPANKFYAIKAWVEGAK